MVIIGLAGPRRSGKDTVANYLVEKYGFARFSFTDALYKEVQEAFGLEDQSILRDAATKDRYLDELRLELCRDREFVDCAVRLIDEDNAKSGALIDCVQITMPLSPRQVLQWWGTEYRRAQDPQYWIARAQEFIDGTRYGYTYPEHAPQYFVETSTAFENEREFITDVHEGNIWHLHRDNLPPSANPGHVSNAGLPVLPGERELWNNDTIERLHYGIDLMMQNDVQFVKVEPMLKDTNGDKTPE